MKTISGKQNTINESILRSVNAGGKAMIEDFMNKRYSNSSYYDIHDDLSVSLNINNAIFARINSFPCWFDEVINLSIENCAIENFTLPRKARLVEITNCEKLKSIKTKGHSEIDRIYIENCPNIDLSEIADLNVKIVKIFKCGIKTLKGLEGVVRFLNVRTCGKLHTYDLKPKYNPQMIFTICPLRYFNEPLNASSFTMDGTYGVKDLELSIGTVTDFCIENPKKDLSSIKITGNALDTIVINNAENLESVSIGVDCKESISFIDLPNINKYELPALISGHVVFEEVKTIPDVNCKRVIKR